MKLKNYLQHKFAYEEQQTINTKHIADLQNSILSEVKKEERQFMQPKYLFLSAALVIVCVLGSVQFLTHTPSEQIHILPLASAQEVIQKTQQALQESTQVYYKVHFSGRRYEKEVSTGFQIVEPPQGIYEFWYDFKNDYVRIEEPDPLTQGKTKLAHIQKKMSENQYITYWYAADPQTKIGEFQEDHASEAQIFYRPTRGLEKGVNLPTNPRVRFEELLNKFGKGNNVKLETIQENGKEYYKLSINQTYNKSNENLQVTQYILIINKNTYQPYKEIQIYEEGKGSIETVYDVVSTDFDANIFGPIPPKGYSIK